MLWCTYANFAEYTAAPQVTALRSLLYKDWNLYTETGAHAFVGWEAGEAAHKLAELMRQSTTQPIVQQFYADMADADATGLPPALTMPTAVLHPRQFPLIDMADVLKLAGALPEGRLLLFEGSSLAPTRGNLDGVLGAIQSLLLETAAPALAQAPRRASGAVAAPVDDGLSARGRSSASSPAARATARSPTYSSSARVPSSAISRTSTPRSASTPRPGRRIRCR